MNDNNDILERLVAALDTKTQDTTSLKLVTQFFLDDEKATNANDTYLYYKKHLSAIVDYLDSIGITRVCDLNKKCINSYVIYAKDRGNKNNTINKKIVSLKSALKYCSEQGHIKSDTFNFLKKLRKDDVETETIPVELVKKILHYLVHLDSTNPFQLRMQMITFVLLDTGIRANELRQLKLDNINLDEQVITLTQTKTRQIRTCFLSDYTVKLLRQYIEVYAVTDFLIVGLHHGNQLHQNYIYKYVFDIIKKDLQISQSISPHKWRHTYATLCLVNGADLEFVRKTLGHTNLNTTQKYLHLSKQHLQDDHKQFSPLANIELDSI